MKRILATAKFIDVPTNISKDFLILTPNSSAAVRLNAPHRSLKGVAVEILNRQGIGVATPLRSLQSLKTAIGKLIPDRDVSSEAARVRPVLATILRDGIDIAAMRKSGLQSAASLAEIAEAYCASLWRDQLVDAESVLWQAGKSITERQKILVYGYFRARGHDIHFIDKLAGDGSIYIVPSGTEPIFASANRSIEWLAEHGWERRDKSAYKDSTITGIAQRFADGKSEQVSDQRVCNAFAYPNLDAEVRATLAAAKRMIVEGTQPDDIALVCRKASDYERTISVVAEEYGVPICSQSETTLAETRLGNYVALILEAVETNLEFIVTARLLSHAYGNGLSDENWAAARRNRASGLKEWKEAGVDLSAFGAEETRTLEGWIGWLLKRIPLALVRERSGANAAELIAYENFCDALDELKAIGGSLEIEFLTFSNAISELLQTFDTVIDPGRGGISFHQPNTMIGGAFDHIFVMGMAEGMLPAATNEAVIDFYEQRQLEKSGVGFDRPVEFPRWEALSFYYVILAALKGITLSYPKTMDIEEKIPSPFFERLGITLVDGRPKSIASRQEELKVFLRRDDLVEDELLTAARHHFQIERRRESSLPYDEYDGVIGIPIKPESRVWSASQLTKIGQCPFKWFAEKVLRFSTNDEADTDLRSNVMGKLYHKTLQLAVERAMRSENFRESALMELEPAFREAEADEAIAVSDLPNWEHRRSEHLTILRKAVESPDFIGEGSRVIATEKGFDVNWNGFPMRGSIDRVDETPEGFIAIDYKTGTYVGKIKGESGELETDIQLPIYSKVALESMFPGRVADGHYFSLRQTKIIKQKAAELESFAKSVKQILQAGALAVDPDGSRKSCKYCDYDSVCRQGQRNARKQS
jgi:RecB family exonuclease